MKTIIVVKNREKKGKTKSIIEFSNLLDVMYPNLIQKKLIPDKNPPKSDFRRVVKINGKVIGIISRGDTSAKLKEDLGNIIQEFQCDLIICASRTRGGTFHVINDTAKKYSYEKIWTSTYHIRKNEEKENIVNKLKAKHLLELIQEFGLL